MELVLVLDNSFPLVGREMDGKPSFPLSFITCFTKKPKKTTLSTSTDVTAWCLGKCKEEEKHMEKEKLPVYMDV